MTRSGAFWSLGGTLGIVLYSFTADPVAALVVILISGFGLSLYERRL